MGKDITSSSFKKILWLLIAAIMLIILGSCGLNNEDMSPSKMNEEDLPDEPAFQDEFTREFLQSTEPVRDGFYPFLSKSGSFTMDFPEDMVVSSRSHNIGPENNSETISFAHSDREKDVFSNYILHYYKGISSEENSKNQISKSHEENLDFTDVDTASNTNLSFAEYKTSEQLYVIGALSWDENEQIQITVRLRCNDNLDPTGCSKQVGNEKESVIKQLKSINLINNEI